MFQLEDGQRVLMIGDSITDCDRRGNHKPLGAGYVREIADLVAARYPERSIEFINQGISGNTVRDLARRWETDVLAYEPDWLSISIGINDVWRQLDGRPEQAVLIDEYRATYGELLVKSTASGKTRLILMETSVIGEQPDAEGNRLLEPYNLCIRQLAAEYGAVVVPMRRAFFTAIARRPQQQWTTDGVHPNAAGHALMALTWLGALGW
ncbi:MAG TPA: SGNH/GDSL hydrolase family protein [Limnochordia bacterium]|nr:SGNH/GDSL hydrolase family protein [Limnochordia bacterium]